MEAKIAFVTEVLWVRSVCYSVRSILYVPVPTVLKSP